MSQFGLAVQALRLSIDWDWLVVVWHWKCLFFPTFLFAFVWLACGGFAGVSRSADKSVAASQFCSFWLAKYDKLATLEFK